MTINKISHTYYHRTRWFEADASRKGADYFDINSFVNDIDSPYQNPRKPSYNKTAFPTSGTFHWTDVPIAVVSLGLLVILLSL